MDRDGNSAHAAPIERLAKAVQGSYRKSSYRLYLIVDTSSQLRSSAALVKLLRITYEDALSVLRGMCSFEAILVDLQRPDLRLQSGSWHAELDRRTGGSIHLSSAFAQRSLDDTFLLRRKILKSARPT